AYSDGLEAAVARAGPGEAGHYRHIPREGTTASVVSGFSRTRNSATNEQHAVDFLRHWIDALLSETIGRTDGPIVWLAWTAFREERWDAIVALDEEATALRPSSAARRASRAMGLRLLTTWSSLHPDPRLEHALGRAGSGDIGPSLPV